MRTMKFLFPSLGDASFGIKDLAEEEYEVEMLERLRRVRFLLFYFGFPCFFFVFSLTQNPSSSMTSHPQHHPAQSTWKDSYDNIPPNLSKELQLSTVKRSRNGEGNKQCVSPPPPLPLKTSLSYDTAVQKEITPLGQCHYH